MSNIYYYTTIFVRVLKRSARLLRHLNDHEESGRIFIIIISNARFVKQRLPQS